MEGTSKAFPHAYNITCGVLLLLAAGMQPSLGAEGSVSEEDGTAAFTLQAGQTQSSAALDFVNARFLKLPLASGYSPDREQLDVISALTRVPSLSNIQRRQGFTGSGQRDSQSPDLGRPAQQGTTSGGGNAPLQPLEAGTSGLPFSTARADLDPQPTNEQYPYRAAGKLFFLIGSNTYICSASLINRGIVVTAAHCVANFGQKQYYSGWQFVPGYRDGKAPYGAWGITQARVLDAYYQGTDDCAQPGVVCKDDVAVLVLTPKQDSSGKSYYAGENTGWFAYGWNSAGFSPAKGTHITQLGYPACLDNGGLMERNDTQGVSSSSFSNNTVAGSLMCGGSSGGPWLINFGIRPSLTGTVPGSSPEPNEVVGVTSWGSTDNAVKQMGASPFLDTNLPVLITAACKAYPEVCK